jgi:hypothetical protein
VPHFSSDELLIARLFELPAEDRNAFWQRACTEDPSLPSRHPEFADLSSPGVAPIPPGEAAAAPLAADAMNGALASALRTSNDSAPGVHIGPMADVLKSALGAADHEAPGVRIGHYKLLQKIGEGGFGAVWMAEQLEPIRRRVAMKIVKVGMDTEEVIARFEAERQALALMDHPNIAKVLDAGATPDGRKAWTPLSEGVSPVQGADRCGPTASVRSVAKMDHVRTGGTLLNQKFTPQVLATDEGLDKLVQLVRTYFKLDGHHIQFNVVDATTLRAAQENPEQYRSLIVRVAGYSDYFCDLSKTLQEEIIARTVHEGF